MKGFSGGFSYIIVRDWLTRVLCKFHKCVRRTICHDKIEDSRRSNKLVKLLNSFSEYQDCYATRQLKINLLKLVSRCQNPPLDMPCTFFERD